MNSLYSASNMLFALSGKICSMSKLWSRKTSKELKNLVCSDMRGISFAESCYAEKSKLVIRMRNLLVFHVSDTAYITKVRKPVVAFDSIDVIYYANRKPSVNIHPRKTVRLKSIFRDFYYAIARCIYVSSGNDARIATTRTIRNPSKNSCFWIVMKKFAQAFCGKIGVSHDAVLSLIGQRPARVDSTCWPRHFTAIQSMGVIA